MTKFGYTGNIAKDLKNGEVSFQPWAETLYKHRVATESKEDPQGRCVLSGVPRENVVPYPFKILNSDGVIVILYEALHSYRQIFMDGRNHPKDPDPTWYGDSIGKWDGDTLVVDTVGFNDKSWLFFVVPHTEMLHVTQRLRRPDLGHLEIETTYEDPGTFKTPVKFKMMNVLTPDEEVQEVVCENNQYAEHVSVK